MFWTAFVWGIGATVGGSIGLMVFVILFAAWSRVAKTPAAVRANELAELTYEVMVQRKELTEKQLNAVTAIRDDIGTLAAVVMGLSTQEEDTYNGESGEDLCNHPHYSSHAGLGGFEG
jgi:hypothetical protein